VETQGARTGKIVDKVYAVLGLTNNWRHFVIEPSYAEDHTSGKLCLEMTTEVITGAPRLMDIIFLGGREEWLSQLPTEPDLLKEERLLNLPSWCPNYLRIAVKPADEMLARYISEMDEGFRLGSARHRWAATGTSKPDLRFIDICNETLVVRDLFLGTVNGFGSILGEDKSCQKPDPPFKILLREK